jgi:hypothetical protein
MAKRGVPKYDIKVEEQPFMISYEDEPKIFCAVTLCRADKNDARAQPQCGIFVYHTGRGTFHAIVNDKPNGLPTGPISEALLHFVADVKLKRIDGGSVELRYIDGGSPILLSLVNEGFEIPALQAELAVLKLGMSEALNDIKILRAELASVKGPLTWHNLPLSGRCVPHAGGDNSWQPPQFAKDAKEFVYLRGMVKGAESGKIFANLPPEYRPRMHVVFTIATNAKEGLNHQTQLAVLSDGSMKAFVDISRLDGQHYLSLSGVMFSTN